MRVALVGLIICLVSCQPETTFEYYTSPDKRNLMTVVKHQGRVYFTRARFTKPTVPPNFIWPISGLDNAYFCYIHWCGSDGVEILSPYRGEWLDTEKDALLTFRQIDNDEYASIEKSKSQDYILCYGTIGG